MCIRIKITKGNIKSKHKQKQNTFVLLVQDNAPVRITQFGVTEVANCSFELLLYPFYSKDLDPLDFFQFPKFISHL